MDLDDVCLSGCRNPRSPHRPGTESCLTASGPWGREPLRGGRKAERVGHVWVGRVLGEALGPATRSWDPWEERREQGRRGGGGGVGRWQGQVGVWGAGRWGRVAAVLGALPLWLIGPLSSPDVATLRLPLKQPSPLLLPAPGLAGDPAVLPLPPRPPHTCPVWQELPGRNYQQHQGGRHPGRPLCPHVLWASLSLGALLCPHCSPLWVNRRTVGPLAMLCAFLKWLRVLVKRNNILEHARSGCSQLWSPIQSIQQPRNH